MSALRDWLDGSTGDAAFAVFCLLIGFGGVFWGFYQRAQRIDQAKRGSQSSKRVAVKNASGMFRNLEGGRR